MEATMQWLLALHPFWQAVVVASAAGGACAIIGVVFDAIEWRRLHRRG